MDLDFPLIYCNGCSYSDDNYSPPIMMKKTYPHYLNNKLQGYVLNKAIAGSNNRRIIRTSIHDILHQRQLNPTQPIVALIQLTFEVRNELWRDKEKHSSLLPEESNFHTTQFSGMLDWKERLLTGKNIFRTKKENKQDRGFYAKLQEARAFYYSSYDERINLLMDLVTFKYFLDANGVKFLIFQGPKAQKLDEEYLLDFFAREVYNDGRVINLEDFGFTNWAADNNFSPLSPTEPRDIGHYGPDAHESFANQILIPKLKQTGQL